MFRILSPVVLRWKLVLPTCSLFLFVAACLTVPPAAGTAAPPEPEQKPSLGERLPRVPHTPADKAIETFALAAGFTVELVAAEPLVADPVDACFDADGRMFVCEMHGYPFSEEPNRLNPQGGGKKQAGIIRMLEDTNGDGKLDRSTVFADTISWPTSVCCYRGGVFVLAAPELYYFRDTTGDGRADVREVVLSGFSRDNVQGLTNNLKWGLDNHIWFAGGRNGAAVKHRGRPLFNLRNQDVRFDPRAETFELVSGGLQFGHSMDDTGNRFVCSNSNHMLHVLFPGRYLRRNPYLAVAGTVRSIAKEGGAGPVFRRSPPEPWRIVRQEQRAAQAGYRLVQGSDGTWKFIATPQAKGRPPELPTGNFTSATGVTIYRGGAWPEQFRGNAFIGDVGGNLVHRKTVTGNQASFTAQRADAGRELLASTDNWFRPVNFVNAPDGSLYILDMYRETIEHPFSIPAEIKEFLHLESGDDRGRIYRLLAPGSELLPPVKLSGKSSAELVPLLQSSNMWHRETAQRLLWERQDTSVVPALRELAKQARNPLGRIHALWTLDGLGALTAPTVILALKDTHPAVREHAARLSEPLLNDHPELVSAVVELTKDDHPRVRFQVAFSLGETTSEAAVEGLVALARTAASGDLRTAILSSAAGTADRIAIRLLAEESLSSGGQALLAELCRVAGANPDPTPSLNLLAAMTRDDISAAMQRKVLSAVGEGLQRRGATVEQLLSSKQATDEVRQGLTSLFTEAAENALDEDRPVAGRAVAVSLLAFAPFPIAEEPLEELLGPQTPPPVQLAAITALSSQRDPAAGPLLLSQWRGYSPKIRSAVVDALMTSVPRIELLLEAVADQEIRPAEIERDRKQLLLNHTNTSIRDLSRKLFGGEVNSNRAKVVAAYQSALELEGDLERGRQQFVKRCSVCHKVGDVGHQVGPDLASIKNKSPADMVVAIMDPNREAQANYTTYTVVTEEGRLYSGIIAAETATSITLRRAEGKQDLILRSNIDMLVSNGKSLMPEGLEKDVTPQELADIIRFVQAIKPKKPEGGK